MLAVISLKISLPSGPADLINTVCTMVIKNLTAGVKCSWACHTGRQRQSWCIITSPRDLKLNLEKLDKCQTRY